MKDNSKAKARLEIELLDKSKDIDKYAHQTAIAVFVALFVAVFSILIPIYLSAMAVKNYFLAGSIFVIMLGFVMWFGKTKLKPISDSFNKKYKVMKKRYNVLGVSTGDLEEEIRETTLH